MRITARVKARAKTARMKKLEDGSFSISVKPPAIDGKANDAVIELVGEYFHVPKRNISIARGHTNKIKIIDIS